MDFYSLSLRLTILQLNCSNTENDFIDPHSTRNWRLVALVAFVCRVMVCFKVFRIFS